jgi:hypothetical protein
VFMIMDNAINPTIRGALPKTADNTKTFMTKIEEYFNGSSKTNTSILMSKLTKIEQNECLDSLKKLISRKC